MTFLDFSHDPVLVLASLLVAMISGFTGLSLTKGLSERSVTQRKVLIVLASIALGGGIWSMHFVAMLGLQLPILYYYDAAVTLASALIAILVVGVALLILHFRARTRLTLILAGGIVGMGVVAMHYLGMSAMQLCRAIYSPSGIVLALTASIGLNIAAFAIAYGKRTQRNIIFGTLFFGLSVFAVHFVAIGGTRFIAVSISNEVGPLISNEVMAIGVVLSSFVLCGAFLLTGVTFLSPAPSAEISMVPLKETVLPIPPDNPSEPVAALPTARIPYEQDGRTRFADPAEVAAIRAEGHYTYLYTKSEKLFCIWSITEAEKRLGTDVFIRTHRSYLLNPGFVTGFERLKDSGVCHVETPHLVKVPVSRSRLSAVRDVLGV